MRGIVNQVIERLLESGKEISSTEVARAAGISRQAAHKQLRRLVTLGVVSAEGNARACRYRPALAAPAPLRTRLDVASAGSMYRLSARLLLDGIESGEVTLSFTGVMEVGEEFLEEIFLVWAPAHPRATLRVVHLPTQFAGMILGLARKHRELTPPAQPALAT
jgi:DNA-binding Lrp family transcriptional regulator